MFIMELLFIFFARILDVSLGTIRMILVIRGDKVPAATIGFFEIMVLPWHWVSGRSLEDPVNLIIFLCRFFSGSRWQRYRREAVCIGFAVIIERIIAILVTVLSELVYQ